MGARELAQLVGVIHLPPLPGSPRYGGRFAPVLDAAARDAAALATAGFDGILVENFGDAPFLPGAVGPETVAAMTAAARRVRGIAPNLALGINVLRNDAKAALAVAIASEAAMARVNVHLGARLCDQGIVQGKADETLRYRRAIGAEHVALLCDVAVKHSAALAPRPIRQEAVELCERGLCDAVLVTGSATGEPVLDDELSEVAAAIGSPPARARPSGADAPGVPVFAASGVTAKNIGRYREAYGVIVGSALRASGKAGDPIDPRLAKELAAAWNKVRRGRR